ncbi:translation initiation factor IF-2 [Candidatus Symbiothrix dinenymphae]|uniref:translation initiation factor IF-2 n=1 Tax=Candidatus Symbiothrix dinenymphae TaxID=467085 RepID=UPI000703080A|nr:translation initiation factor IF-2 [Candidatus Symbiothrix dinenymphae]
MNVGLTTVVEFLQRQGYDHPDADPNTKIEDVEYDLLVNEFSLDKNLKKEAEKIRFDRRDKDKKGTVTVPGYVSKGEIPTVIPEKLKPKFTVTGKIKLDKRGNPIADKKQKEVVAAPPKESKESKEKKRGKGGQTQKEKVGGITLVNTPTPSGATTVGEPFRYFPKPTIEGPKVTGSIDLSIINLSTRPKKKTKKEREQERSDKIKTVPQHVPKRKKNAAAPKPEPRAVPPTLTKKADIDPTQKKKRKRIKNERIDIEKGAPAVKPNPNMKLRKYGERSEVSEEDVQKQVKETLARLTNKTQKKGAKYRKEKRDAFSQHRDEELEASAHENKVLKLTEFVTANDLASMMNVPVVQIISKCMAIGIMVSINQRLDAEVINIVADEFGFKTEYVSAEVAEAIAEDEDNPEDLVARAPIVTVMGHVDHGKTSLLDNIRNTNVIAGEAGGITQHIGAYNVQLGNGRRITFLDTPGHEAFTAMRARGASVTDIAIIIVAADDSVMPQTIEAINHAAAANVPMVFAINKIDKAGADPEKIKSALSQMNYLVEDWGGKYQSQDISAKQGINVNELMEKVLLEADMLELKANPKRKAVGSIIESSLDKGRGYLVTVLVKTGTLQLGDVVLAGTHFGRVKAMFNERNQRITEAGPAEPVLVLGLNGAPQAGDAINVMDTEQEAREIASKREQLQREQGLRTQKMLTLDDIGRRIAIGNFQQLNVIVKGDVDGSVEALSDKLISLSTAQIQVNVIHKGVGQISESDVTLAAASEAIVIGFQVRPSQLARKAAEQGGVDIRLYSIIYDAIEEVKAAMEGMLAPEFKEEITGNVEVTEVFNITKVGTVAGCLVREGKIKRGNKIRIIREGIVIYSGELGSLKRFKDDVKEVLQGYECGLNIQNFNDIKIGDIVEPFEEVEVKATL